MVLDMFLEYYSAIKVWKILGVLKSVSPAFLNCFSWYWDVAGSGSMMVPECIQCVSYQELTCVGESEFVLSKGFTRSVLQSEFWVFTLDNNSDNSFDCWFSAARHSMRCWMNIVALLLTQHWETLLVFDKRCEYESVGHPSNEVFNLRDPCSTIWASTSVYHIQCNM